MKYTEDEIEIDWHQDKRYWLYEVEGKQSIHRLVDLKFSQSEKRVYTDFDQNKPSYFA